MALEHWNLSATLIIMSTKTSRPTPFGLKCLSATEICGTLNNRPTKSQKRKYGDLLVLWELKEEPHFFEHWHPGCLLHFHLQRRREQGQQSSVFCCVGIAAGIDVPKVLQHSILFIVQLKTNTWLAGNTELAAMHGSAHDSALPR